jgi:uncharacterized protein with FMN-binding domain
MKRVLAAVSLTIAGLALVLGFKTRDPVALPTAAAEETTGGSPASTTTAATTASTTGAGSTSATSPGATTTQGTTTSAATTQVDGSVVWIPYGPVQVTAVVSGGTLVDVIAVQLPTGDPHSAAVSSYAEPLLREMALAAQSANIDVVSGATFTSRAYAQSLQAALDAAGI